MSGRGKAWHLLMGIIWGEDSFGNQEMMFLLHIHKGVVMYCLRRLRWKYWLIPLKKAPL